MMKFNSQVCTTREQSERLLSLGLKKETADMYYPTISDDEHSIRACWEDFWSSDKLIDGHIRRCCIPAWSLHRLIEMIPDCITLKDENIEENYRDATLEIHHKAVIYESFMVKIYKFKKKSNNLYDNLIDCIEWLIKEGYFNKEYLEE